MSITVPEDLVTAAHRRLRNHPRFIALVDGGYIGTDAAADALLGEQVSASWLFQGLSEDGRPFRDPEGSGKSAVVLQEYTGWPGSSDSHTFRFPQLQLLVYTDTPRAADGSELALTASRTCKYILSELDRVFHLPGNSEHKWNSMHVHSSLRDGGWAIHDVPGTQSRTVRGEQRYSTITD